MTFGEYIGGAADLLCLLGVLGAASWFVATRRLPGLTRVDRILATATIFTAGVLVSHIVPLCLGILSRASVLATAVVVSVAAVFLARRGTGSRHQPIASYPDPIRPDTPLLRATAWSLTFVACILAIAFLSTVIATAVTHVDFMEFHGPGVARWIQNHSLWPVVRLYPTHPSGYEPNNGEVLLLAVTLPWRSDFLVRLVDVPGLAVIVLALTSMGRHLRVSHATSLVYSILLVSLPVVGLLTLNTAKPDPVLFAAFSVGALFLLRHSYTGTRGDLLIAAAALGIGFGSKWNGMSTVAIVLAVWAAARLASRVAFRRVVGELATAGLVVFAFGSVWLIRNLAATGNPFYPLHAKFAGLTLLPAPEDLQRKRFNATLAQYLTDPHALRHYILPSMYRFMLGAGGVLLAVLLFIAAGVALRAVMRARRRPEPIPAGERPWLATSRAVAGVSAAALLIGIAYLVTPYSAQLGNTGLPDMAWVNVRYGLAAIALAAPCAAWLTDRAGRLRWPLLALAIVGFVDDVHRSFGSRPWFVSPARLVAVGAATLIGLAVVITAWRRTAGLSPHRRRLVAGVVTAVALAGVLTAGFFDQRRFITRRYATFDPALTWVHRFAPKGHRIGLAGQWPFTFFSPELAMFGPRMENHVAYIGPVRRGMLLKYSRRADFQRATRRGRFDLVLVENRPVRGASVEERWLRSLGFTPVATSPTLVLLQSRAARALSAAPRG